ncbi:MAG: P-type Cu+ transporter, partial [Solirubrobacteraceae bacterium]|nr:P-type Cu+ transporter [Solirubrobacteraceae bacterium]
MLSQTVRNPAATPPDESVEVTLAVGGMHCGACAARVERTLNGLDGVAAQVNYATERATATIAAHLDPGRLIEAVTSAGYTADLVGDDPHAPAATAAPDELARRMRSLRNRLLLAAALFMPLCDFSLQFSNHPAQRYAGWQWFMVALAAPVITWAAWPFYQSALRNARHRTTTMDTLV